MRRSSNVFQEVGPNWIPLIVRKSRRIRRPPPLVRCLSHTVIKKSHFNEVIQEKDNIGKINFNFSSQVLTTLRSTPLSVGVLDLVPL